MTKEQSERRTYRKSPGRQYGYEYDPLRNNQGQSHNGKTGNPIPTDRREREHTNYGAHHFTDANTLNSQRPNLRRTRQLMRKSILDSKTRDSSNPLGYDSEEDYAESKRTPVERTRRTPNEDSTLYSSRYLARTNSRRPSQALRQQYSEDAHQTAEAFAEQTDWRSSVAEQDYRDVDPDRGFDDSAYGLGLDDDFEADADPQEDFPEPSKRGSGRRSSSLVARSLAQSELDESPLYEDEFEAAGFQDGDPYPGTHKRRKKSGLTRRKAMLGLGAAAVGLGGLAIYEYGPKIPQALNDAGTTVEHQIADAFNRGFSAGADAVRKDFINALDDMEGVSINTAMAAAHLLRNAYDVFVNPLVTLAANVTGDFLNVTLRAFIQARHWLSNIGQDNSTLASLQTVLDTWTKQVKQMPKQIQAVTDADLDGAQAYLRGVQRKIEAEKAKLNGQVTPTTTTTTPKAQPPK